MVVALKSFRPLLHIWQILEDLLGVLATFTYKLSNYRNPDLLNLSLFHFQSVKVVEPIVRRCLYFPPESSVVEVQC